MTAPHSVPIDELLRHRPFVRALARRLVQDDATADDVTQDTYVAALRQPPSDSATARSWLARVLRRVVIDRGRAGSRRTRRERAVAEHEALESAADVVARMETHRRLVTAVMALEEPFRTTIVLRFHEDLSPREVARRTGVPVETVRSRTRRGLERLRCALDADHGGDRRAWCLPLLAFLDFLDAPESGVLDPPSAPSDPTAICRGATAAGLGATLMATTTVKVLTATAAVLLLGALIWTARSRGEPDAVRTGDVAMVDPGSSRTPARATGGAADRGGGRTRADTATAFGTPTVALHVRDVTGAPVSNATVECIAESAARAVANGDYDRLRRIGVAPALSVRADARGDAAVRDLPPDSWTFVAWAPGFATTTSLALRTRVGQRDQDVELILVAGHRLTGRVFEHDGAPVTGATVAAGELGLARCTTDAHGAFVLDGLPGGDVTLVAGRRGETATLELCVRVPDVTTIDIVFTGGVFAGTVIDADSLEPVPHATLRGFIEGGERGARLEAETDAEGRFETRTLAAGFVESVDVVAPHVVPTVDLGRVEIARGARVERVLRVTRGGSVRGVVRAGGEPAPFALVVCGPAGAGTPLRDRRGWTRTDGTFEILGVPPGPASLSVEDGRAAGAAVAIDVRTGEWTEQDITLPGEGDASGALVTGVVRESNGAAAAGVQVYATGLLQPAVTTSEGRFRLTGVRRGDAIEMLAWSSAAYVRRTLDVRGDLLDLVLVLGDAPRISGSVLDAAGRPVAGARVQVLPGESLANLEPDEDPARAEIWSRVPATSVATDGSFVVRHPLGSSTAVVRAAAEGRTPAVAQGLAPDESRDVRLVLDAGNALTVFAVRAGSRAPVAGAHVRMILDSRGWQPVVAVTDAEGRAEIAGLAARRGRFVVIATDGTSASFELTPHGLSTHTVELPRAQAVAGHVRLADGTPVAGAYVRAEHVDATGGGSGSVSAAAAPAPSIDGGEDRGVLTGADGAFRLDTTSTGALDLVVSSPRTGPLSTSMLRVAGVRVGNLDLELRVLAASTIEGRVEGAGADPSSALVTATSPAGALLDSTRAAVDGRFRLVGVPATGACVTATALDGERRLVRARSVDVAAGARDVVLRLAPPPSIDGTVLDERGDPVSGGLVLARLVDGPAKGGVTHSAPVADDGGFRLADLGAGRYRLRYVGTDGVYAPGAADSGRALLGGDEVTTGTTAVRLLIAADDVRTTVVGTLTDEAGRPLDDAYVHLRAGDHEHTARTSADGRFRIAGLEAETSYELRVWKPGYVWIVLDDVRPGDTAPRLVANRGLTASGRIFDAHGQPLELVEVGLRHAETGAPGQTTTDRDGRFVVTGLVPGDYRVFVRAVGAPPAEVGTIEAGATGEVLRLR